jgi:hypothetical protein
MLAGTEASDTTGRPTSKLKLVVKIAVFVLLLAFFTQATISITHHFYGGRVGLSCRDVVEPCRRG